KAILRRCATPCTMQRFVRRRRSISPAARINSASGARSVKRRQFSPCIFASVDDGNRRPGATASPRRHVRSVSVQEEVKGETMRNIDDIISMAQKAMAASLHEAFEAGRARTASELKSRMAAFFEGLVAEAETNADAPASEEPHHQG